MGFSLRLVADHPAILAMAEELFRGFGPGAPGVTPGLVIHFYADVDAPGVFDPPAYEYASQIVHVRSGGSSLTIDRAQGVAYGHISPALLTEPAFFRRRFLEPALLFMLPSRGLMGVHGSACVRNGRGMLFRARGGQGKTTLAYAASRKRFQALAEDVVWIDPQKGIWWGMPWKFHLLPDAAGLFPELVPGQLLRTDDRTKLVIDPERLRPGSTTASAQPGPVILLRRRPGRTSRLHSLGLAEALASWADGRAGTETDFPGYDEHVSHVLDGKAYRLEFGDDIEAALDLLEPLWDES